PVPAAPAAKLEARNEHLAFAEDRVVPGENMVGVVEKHRAAPRRRVWEADGQRSNPDAKRWLTFAAIEGQSVRRIVLGERRTEGCGLIRHGRSQAGRG